MAIIYTYPKLQNPQGNELIVVSDVNNKNATRLITIADIASLVPGGGGGGCTSAISGILTGAGSYIPPLCNEVTFTGSGIDISADQATGTVTFTVPASTTPCATTTEIGGLKAYPTQVESGDWPQPISEGTYYPIEVVTFLEAGPSQTCVGAVKIPNVEPYTLPCADQDRNLGGIAVEPGFLGTPTASETGSIYPVQVTDDCVAAVRIPDSTPVVSTLTAAQSSGTNADPNLRLTSGANVDDVKLVGGTGINVTRDSDTQITLTATQFGISCANATIIGGIKAGGVDIELPAVATTGNYYPVELIQSEEFPEENNCRAVVKVPTSTATIDCADTTTIGGIKVGSTGSDVNPDITELESSPLAVEVNADCQAYVQVPNAATPGNGQITIAAGTGLTGGGSFTVNQAGASTITLNASGSGGGETGWSPMTITNSATTLAPQGGALTLFYHATADATLDINSIKMMLTDVDSLGNANKDDEFSVALYEGSLTDVANGGPTPTLIGQWSYTPGVAAVFGIKKVFNEVATSVTAGNDYVIGVSVNSNGALLFGDGVLLGGSGSVFMQNQYLCVGNNNLYGTSTGAEWPSDFPDTTFSSSFRYAIHFYEGGEEAGEGEGGGSGEGEVEEKEG